MLGNIKSLYDSKGMQYEFGGLARKELSDIAFKRGILRLCSLGIKAIRGMIRKYRTYCTVRIGSVETLCMLDSGNTAYSACDPRLFKALGLTSDDLRPVRGGSNISTAKKRASLRVLGETKDLIPVQISPFTAPLMIRLVVMPELDMPLNLSGRLVPSLAGTPVCGWSPAGSIRTGTTALIKRARRAHHGAPSGLVPTA